MDVPPVHHKEVASETPAVAGAATVFAGDRVQPIVADLLCPMRVHGHLLGYIAINSAPGLVEIDDEDRLVMDYITAQVASALELHRLGEEIGDAREVGSFHRLSAFIIHDLKNLVAQQSFVLENAQKFSGDPAFVSDALAAFADSTNRMRALIARLRPGAPTGSPAGVTCDVVALLHELTAVARLPGQCRVRIAVPPDTTACYVRAEAGALTEVLTNLLVNAVESLPPDRGEIDVQIVRDLADWCIEVRDNGCGIPEAYMRDDLFRPFRSTKDAGLGIGLYQCKVVIEAAGGRIHVSSRVNVGTTVQIILPAASDVVPVSTNVQEGVVHG
jgi:putative PEP-CTERM system histidine kinase